MVDAAAPNTSARARRAVGRKRAAPGLSTAPGQSAAAAECGAPAREAAAGWRGAAGRREAARHPDARRFAVAAALAIAIDVLSLVLISIFLTEMNGKAVRREEGLWLSVALKPPAELTAGTELQSGTEHLELGPAESEAEPTSEPPPGTELELPSGTELTTTRDLLTQPPPSSRLAAEAAQAAVPPGTELARGTEPSAGGNDSGQASRPGTELAASAGASDVTANSPQGTELTTREDLLIRLDEEIARALTYPPRARARGIEGRVLLDLNVDEIGRLKECSVEASSGSPMLDDAARRLMATIFPLPARLAASFSALVAVEYRLR